MRRILVTFIGRVRKRGDFYEKAQYDFGASGGVFDGTYMGDALLKYLRSRRQPVGMVVLLGTRSSMWDALVEHLHPGEGFEEERDRVIDLVREEAVDQACLDRLRPLMSKVLDAECRPQLIGMARNKDEQLDILHRMLDSIGPVGADDELVLDTTHGFRHLPMLGLMAAMYFQVAFACRIGGVYYGAFDMRDRDGPTPVVQLDGLMQISRWVTRLHSYNGDGDPEPFAALLQEDRVVSPDGGRALRRLAYFERTGQVERAQREADLFCADAGTDWPGVSGLFEARLLERLPQPGQSLYDRQRQLTFLHLEHRDFLRAAILGFEATITRLAVEAGRDPGNPAVRDWVREGYRSLGDAATSDALDGLRRARNALAHADEKPDERVAGALANPADIQGFLNRRLRQLLP